MDTGDLISRYPRLYHMATAGSWDSIARHGLQTTNAIVESSSLSSADKRELLQERRAQSVTINHPRFGNVTIRDQKPLNLANLQTALTDMSVEEWLKSLNNRVFFWLHPDRLAELLSARAYRKEEHDVITVDTASLLASEAGARVRLSSLNSGSTIYPNAPARGSDTFSKIGDYDFDDFRRRRSSDMRAIGELAVLDGVSDLIRHVDLVERRQADRTIAVIYERP